MTKLLRIEDSVRAYIENRAFRSGVQAIMDSGAITKTPAGLDWKELTEFYRAVGGAVRVASDFAIAYAEMWELIWAPYTNELKLLDPDDTHDLDWDIAYDLQAVWNKGHCRCFEDKVSRRRIGTYSTFNEKTVSIGIAVQRRGKFLELELQDFEPDFDFLNANCPMQLGDDGIDLSEAVNEAARAMAYLATV